MFGTLSYSYSENNNGTITTGSGMMALINTSYSVDAHYIKVDNMSDTSDSSYCTLRDAINSWADPTTTYGGCTQGSSTLTNILHFAPSDTNSHTITLDNTNPNEDTNSSGDLDLNCSNCTDVTIIGCGSDNTIISANDADRVFHLNINNHNREVTLSGMTVQDGNPPSGIGGGIFSINTKLNLYDIHFKDNLAGRHQVAILTTVAVVVGPLVSVACLAAKSSYQISTLKFISTATSPFLEMLQKVVLEEVRRRTFQAIVET